MAKTGVYKITNPINEVYIGQSIDIEYRFNTHITTHISSESKLQKSFRKYGTDNHIFEIIELCLESDLNYRERYWQEFYNSFENGLNSVLVVNSEKKKKRTKYNEPTKIVSFRIPISMVDEITEIVYACLKNYEYER